MSEIGKTSQYSWDPSFYLANSELQYNFAKVSLNKIPFKGNEQILDIGCGPGIITAQMANLVPKGKIIGMDFSPDMINFASKAFNEMTNLSFKQADVRYFDFNQEFDLITSFSALHWVLEQEAALNQICKHLKPSGFFLAYLSAPIFENAPILKVNSSILKDKKWASYFENFSVYDYLIDIQKEQYNQFLIKAGFKIIHFDTINQNYTFSSIEHLANWFKAWSPLGYPIPLEYRNAFFLMHAQMFVEETKQNSGNIIYNFDSWNILATK